MFLDPETFRTVISATPLVSIDFVVRNSQGEILLGQRMNRPAQGYWFVPGGRVLKNETLEQAFKRLSLQELGVCFSRDDAKLMGVYEHFYSDSTFGDAPGTHYVVIGYYLKLSCDVILDLPKIQHNQFRWCSLTELEVDYRIHEYSRAYLSALLKMTS